MQYLLVSYNTAVKGSRAEAVCKTADAMIARWRDLASHPAPGYTVRMFIDMGNGWQELTVSKPIVVIDTPATPIVPGPRI